MVKQVEPVPTKPVNVRVREAHYCDRGLAREQPIMTLHQKC